MDRDAFGLQEIKNVWQSFLCFAIIFIFYSLISAAVIVIYFSFVFINGNSLEIGRSYSEICAMKTVHNTTFKTMYRHILLNPHMGYDIIYMYKISHLYPILTIFFITIL